MASYRSPPWTAVTALLTVVPADADVSVRLSVRRESVPTPLLPLASPTTGWADVVTATPVGWLEVSAGTNVIPLPVAPEDPTAVIVTCSAAAPVSIVSGAPTTKLVVLATLTLVAPDAAATPS